MVRCEKMTGLVCFLPLSLFYYTLIRISREILVCKLLTLLIAVAVNSHDLDFTAQILELVSDKHASVLVFRAAHVLD